MTAVPLAAQQGGQWSFKLAGGYAVPLGSYHDFVKDGWQGQIGAGYFPRGGRAGLTIEYSRSWNNVDRVFLDQFGIPEGQSRLWSVTLNGVVTPAGGGGRIRPYLIAGGGYYHRTADFYRSTAAVSMVDPWWGFVGVVPARAVLATFGDGAIGLNGGLGLLLALGGGGAVFLEGRYHYAFTHAVHSQLLPITLGFAYSY